MDRGVAQWLSACPHGQVNLFILEVQQYPVLKFQTVAFHLTAFSVVVNDWSVHFRIM